LSLQSLGARERRSVAASASSHRERVNVYERLEPHGGRAAAHAQRRKQQREQQRKPQVLLHNVLQLLSRLLYLQQPVLRGCAADAPRAGTAAQQAAWL